MHTQRNRKAFEWAEAYQESVEKTTVYANLSPTVTTNCVIEGGGRGLRNDNHFMAMPEWFLTEELADMVALLYLEGRKLAQSRI